MFEVNEEISVTAVGVGELTSAFVATVSRAAEIFSAGAGSPAASAESRMEFGVLVPLARQEDEPEDGASEEALAEAWPVFSGNEKEDEYCAGTDAEAGACSDELTDSAKLGMTVAVLDPLTFSDVSAGAVVLPAAGARFGLSMFPLGPPPSWFAGSTGRKLSIGCVCALVKVLTGTASWTGGKGASNARTGLPAAVGAFFAEFLAAGALAVLFPVGADGFEGSAVAGAAA